MARVLITADLHGYNLDKVESMRNDYDFMLDCGDYFHGSENVNPSKGETALPLARSYDAMVSGNHDYLYKYDRYMELSKQINCIACNLLYKPSNTPIWKPYALLGENNIYELGVIGVASNGNLCKGTRAIATLNVPAEIQKHVNEIREKCRRVIVIAHYPCSKTGDNAVSKMIKKTSGLDAFFGGHAHIDIVRTAKDKAGNLVPYAECGHDFASYLIYDTETNIMELRKF